MHLNLSSTLWIVWYLYWIASARNRIRDTGDSKAKREPLAGRIGYTALLIAGFALLVWHVHWFGFDGLLWLWRGWYWVGLAMEAVGLGVAIWARRTLGRNWTGRITTGGTQELVIRGPYRFVRHPIYSGLLFAVLGTALVVGRPRAFVGFTLILVGVLVKVRREEAALREHFGGEYGEYERQAACLLPGFF